MATIHLTPRQEGLAKALVACGYYGNLSEVGRAAMEKFIHDLPAAQRRELALHLYRQGEATVSRAAEIADLPLHEMRKVLVDEGAQAPGRELPADERRARAKTGAAKYR